MTLSFPAPQLPSAHRAWLEAEERQLLDFGAAAVRGDGMAAWLDVTGRPDSTKPAHTFFTGRLCHVYFLAALRGIPGARLRAGALLTGLDTVVRDHRYGGWLNAGNRIDTVKDDLMRETDSAKQCYTHSFVVLAAATGTAAGHPTAARLLDEALAVTHQHFFEPSVGLFTDSTSRDFTTTDRYRGINANMHMVEALLAAADATGNPTWAGEAATICMFTISQAERNQWRIPEHYDTGWRPLLDYNIDEPAHQFKPYGATIGHAFEWARLLVQASHTVSDPARFVEAARQLVDRAVADGWARPGRPGFSYTTDWTGTPVIDDRLHWVPAEAIGATAALWRVTGEPRYRDWYTAWWDHVATCFVDRKHGSWHHQLDATNTVTDTIWDGKPDLYHAYQCVLFSLLPPTTSLAGGVLAANRTGRDA